MQYAQLKRLPERHHRRHLHRQRRLRAHPALHERALLDTGDEVLIPRPGLPALDRLRHARPAARPCTTSATSRRTGTPDIADIESKVTSNTKAIVIINPNNPTGAVYPHEVLEQIVGIARRHQLIIFSDEIYDRLCMDGDEAHLDRLARARPAVRDVLRPLQVPHGRRLPRGLDGRSPATSAA